MHVLTHGIVTEISYIKPNDFEFHECISRYSVSRVDDTDNTIWKCSSLFRFSFSLRFIFIILYVVVKDEAYSSIKTVAITDKLFHVSILRETQYRVGH